jgi:hypothetical protein
VGGESAAVLAKAGDEHAATPLREAVRTLDFWLLAGSFFICGYTTNGLIGTHLLPHTVEHGFVEVEAAGALALMGMMNIVGTMASGWLTGLLIFAVIYGLDWVATVPPTVNLTARRFGRASLGTIYGWIFCSHMIGAGIAAQAGCSAICSATTI